MSFFYKIKTKAKGLNKDIENTREKVKNISTDHTILDKKP